MERHRLRKTYLEWHLSLWARFVHQSDLLGKQVKWDKGGIEPATSENMNGGDNSLEIEVNGHNTRKWILSKWGFGVEGAERWEFVNTVSIKGRTFLEQLSDSLPQKAFRLDGWLGGKFCR